MKVGGGSLELMGVLRQFSDLELVEFAPILADELVESIFLVPPVVGAGVDLLVTDHCVIGEYAARHRAWLVR